MTIGRSESALEEFEGGFELTRLPCSHVYQGDCIVYRDLCFLNFKISKFSAFEFVDESRNRLNDRIRASLGLRLQTQKALLNSEKLVLEKIESFGKIF